MQYVLCKNDTIVTIVTWFEYKYMSVNHSSRFFISRMCMYVLVTEKTGLICKGHLSYTCDFLTKYQGRTDPAMKIGMHICSACTQYVL